MNTRRETPPVFKEGQVVCVLLPHQKDKDKEVWQLGQIKKINYKKSKDASEWLQSINITLYSIREDSVSSQAEWQAHYPGVHLPNEVIILARIQMGMPLVQSERALWSVTIKEKELLRRVCPATAREFERRIYANS